MLWEWVKKVLGFDGHKYGKYYVYELRDPRFTPSRTFYVGKGTEDRVYQHEKDARKYLKTRAGVMKLQPKHKRIIEIWDDGYKVEYYILFRTDNECEAYEVERLRIEHYGLEKLTNETYGNKNCIACAGCGRRLKVREHIYCVTCQSTGMPKRVA